MSKYFLRDRKGDKLQENPKAPSNSLELEVANKTPLPETSESESESETSLNQTLTPEVIMTYVFPVEIAYRVIPDFSGEAEEVENFLAQADFIASLIPATESTIPLVGLVLSKLKGPALESRKKLQAKDWKSLRKLLVDEFKCEIRLEKVIHDLETLQQLPNESYKDYCKRSRKILDLMEQCEDGFSKKPYMQRSIRMHFLAGLRDKGLKNAAQQEKGGSFEELTKYLETVHQELDEIKELESRLKNFELSSKKKSDNQQQHSGRGANYDEKQYKFKRYEDRYQNNDQKPKWKQEKRDDYYDRQDKHRQNDDNRNRYHYNENRGGYHGDNRNRYHDNENRGGYQPDQRNKHYEQGNRGNDNFPRAPKN
uniref:Retrotransposon gag domain-containing protein n=1 Tax=Anopheles darlingi TaxID=43151 RepID=A0A2M4CWP3_ANODA